MIRFLLSKVVHSLVAEALEANAARVREVTAAINGADSGACIHEFGKWQEVRRLSRNMTGTTTSILAQIIHSERQCSKCGWTQRSVEEVDYSGNNKAKIGATKQVSK